MMKAKMKAGGGMMKKGYQAGGRMGRMDEEELMDRMGRGMAKAEMQKKQEMMGKMSRGMQKGGIAEAIKKHEKSSPVHKAGLKSGGPTKKMMAGGGMTKKMQAGGGVTRADGIVKKGHTKGTMV